MRVRLILPVLFLFLALIVRAEDEAIEISSKIQFKREALNPPSLTLMPGDYGKVSVALPILIPESSFRLPAGILLTAHADIQNNKVRYSLLFTLRDFQVIPQDYPSLYSASTRTTEIVASGYADFNRQIEIQLIDNSSCFVTFKKVLIPSGAANLWSARQFSTFLKTTPLTLEKIRKRFGEPSRIIHEKSKFAWEYDLRDKRKVRIIPTSSNTISSATLYNPYTNSDEPLLGLK